MQWRIQPPPISIDCFSRFCIRMLQNKTHIILLSESIYKNWSFQDPCRIKNSSRCAHFFCASLFENPGSVPGGISSSILSVFFTDKFALSQSDARISVAYKICQWKSLTKRLMKCPPDVQTETGWLASPPPPPPRKEGFSLSTSYGYLWLLLSFFLSFFFFFGGGEETKRTNKQIIIKRLNIMEWQLPPPPGPTSTPVSGMVYNKKKVK